VVVSTEQRTAINEAGSTNDLQAEHVTSVKSKRMQCPYRIDSKLKTFGIRVIGSTKDLDQVAQILWARGD